MSVNLNFYRLNSTIYKCIYIDLMYATSYVVVLAVIIQPTLWGFDRFQLNINLDGLKIPWLPATRCFLFHGSIACILSAKCHFSELPPALTH